LQASGLKKASGNNPNMLFLTDNVPKPKLNFQGEFQSVPVKEVFEYDLYLKKGEVLEVKAGS
jgi:hypothetical protein